MRALAFSAIGAAILASPLQADTCLTLTELTPSHTARILAGGVRACVAQERYRDAIQLFFAYSNFSLFDQQRVWDVTSHVAVQELHGWIFSGYSQDQIAALKGVIEELRTPGSELLRATCQSVARAGPPDYRPDYMIKRGEIPRRNSDDWLTEGFDPDAAWTKALIEINKCPADLRP